LADDVAMKIVRHVHLNRSTTNRQKSRRTSGYRHEES
jgi:hypothetical protein